MEDLGRLQAEVWSRIREATKKGDGIALRVSSPVAAEMDGKYAEWKSRVDFENPPGPDIRTASVNGNGPKEDLTGRRIRAVVFDGERIPVGSFRDALEWVVAKLQEKHSSTFDTIAPQVRGRGPYFSEQAKQLRHPSKVASSKLYMETNLSSTMIAQTCRRLVEAFGYDSKALQFDVEPVRTRAHKHFRR